MFVYVYVGISEEVNIVLFRIHEHGKFVFLLSVPRTAILFMFRSSEEILFKSKKVLNTEALILICKSGAALLP
jgi:hypothetical protein